MGTMSCGEAGKLGGLVTASRHGPAWMASIARRAGRPAPAVASAVGRKGGLATRASHDRAFFQTIGRRGGLSVLEHFGREHFVEAGRKGALVRAARRRQQQGEV